MKRMAFEAAVALLVVALIAWLLLSCTTGDVIEGATGETLQETLDRECEERGYVCARVREYTEPADNPLGLVEMCTRDEDIELAESIHGASRLSTHERFERFAILGVEPMCIWCEGFGGNSYSGSFNCPTEAP